MGMFGWVSDRFTNTGKLERAARNAKAAANKYGTQGSRNTVKQAAVDLDLAAETTKGAIQMAEESLKTVQNKCSSEIGGAMSALKQAKESHNKVKDTTYQRLGRFATLGRAGWGATRSAAVNIAQKRTQNAATKKRDQLRELATKQKAAMDAEDAALQRRRDLIKSALNTANSAANAAAAATNSAAANPAAAKSNGKLLMLENGPTEGGGRRRRRRRGRTYKKH